MSSTFPLQRVRTRLAEFPEAVAITTFLVMFLAFALVARHFVTPVALSNTLTFGSVLGIVVVGVAVLMIAGEFDLSVGSNFAVASYVFALTMNGGTPPLVAMILALITSTALGALNGVIVIRSGIPSFIATLGTMLAFRGIARVIGHGDFARYTGPRPALFDVLNGPVGSLNQMFEPAGNFRFAILWFILIVAIVSVVMMRTRFGNWVFATGGNAGAAMAQGVPVRRVKLAAFALTGLLAGLASVMQFSYRTSVDPLRGEGWEMLAVAACVIGGVRLTGGFGTILGAAIGCLLLQMLDQGLVLMGLSVQIFRAVAGAILIFSVILNTILSPPD